MFMQVISPWILFILVGAKEAIIQEGEIRFPIHSVMNVFGIVYLKKL